MINPSARSFIKKVALTSVRVLLKKYQHAFTNAGTDDVVNLDCLDEELGRLCDGADEDDINDSEPDVDFDVGDSVGKALTLITQVSVL